MSTEEMHSYPLASIPLTLSDPSDELQQSQKASFRD